MDELPHLVSYYIVWEGFALPSVQCPYDPTDENRPCKSYDTDGNSIDGCRVYLGLDAAGWDAVCMPDIKFQSVPMYYGWDDINEIPKLTPAPTAKSRECTWTATSGESA